MTDHHDFTVDETKELLLGRIFAAEIGGCLPYQSKAAGYKRLEAYGLCEYVTEKLPGRFVVTVSGWMLTHKGRYLYCKNA